VFVEYYGIKGIYLNPRAAEVLYAITYPDGHVIRYDRPTGTSAGTIARIGQAKHGAFVGYTDNRGSFYFETASPAGLALQRYDRTTGAITPLATVPGVEVGAVAPTSCGEVVYWLVADTKTIYRHDCRSGQFSQLATACGSNWWRLYNLSLSPNGEGLYYISNNNARSTIRRIDVRSDCRAALAIADGSGKARNPTAQLLHDRIHRQLSQRCRTSPPANPEAASLSSPFPYDE